MSRCTPPPAARRSLAYRSSTLKPIYSAVKRCTTFSNKWYYKKHAIARPLSPEFLGAVYHLSFRGNARQKVFFTYNDRDHFFIISRSMLAQTRGRRKSPRAIAGRKTIPTEDFCQTRKKAIEAAYKNHGYRMREIAEYVGVHYATVSRRLKGRSKSYREHG